LISKASQTYLKGKLNSKAHKKKIMKNVAIIELATESNVTKKKVLKKQKKSKNAKKTNN